MAGIIQRKNKWVAVFKNADGRELRKTTGIDVVPKVLKPGESLKTVRSLYETRARLIANELERMAKGGVPDVDLMRSVAGESTGKLLHGRVYMQSVVAFLEEWLVSRRDKAGAADRDGKAVRQFLAFLGERRDMALSMLNATMARDFMEQEMERVSSGTVKRYMTSLSCAFNRAVASRVIVSNPFRGVVPRKSDRHDKQERAAFTVDEVRRILASFPDEWPDMVRVCLYTGGQRLGDVARLAWDQIDLETGLLYLTTEKTKRRMSKPVIAPLKDLLVRRAQYRANEYVFPIASMKHAQAGGKSSKLSLEFTALLRQYGFIGEHEELEGDKRKLSEKSFHSLRATAVTVLRLAGVSPDLCRFIVGHDSEEIERAYIRPQQSAVIEAMDVLVHGLEGGQ